MPFCTSVRHAEPRRRAVLLAVRHPARVAAPRPPAPAPGDAAGESTATIPIGAPASKAETVATASSTRSTRPRSTRCPPGHALLVVQRGPSAGSRFLLDADVVTAGRHPDSEIFLDDVTVSRRHAEFHRDGDAFTVADVGSLNGTYVNRDRIDEVAADRRRRGPDRQVPAGVLRRARRAAERGSTSRGLARPRPPAGADEHRGGARPAARRTSRTSPSPRSGSSRPRG